MALRAEPATTQPRASGTINAMMTCPFLCPVPVQAQGVDILPPGKAPRTTGRGRSREGTTSQGSSQRAEQSCTRVHPVLRCDKAHAFAPAFAPATISVGCPDPGRLSDVGDNKSTAGEPTSEAASDTPASLLPPASLCLARKCAWCRPYNRISCAFVSTYNMHRNIQCCMCSCSCPFACAFVLMLCSHVHK